MITASHNAAPDNGVKIVDTDGGMLTSSWEKYAEQLANAAADQVSKELDTIVALEKIDTTRTGNIFIAKDTRESSEYLSELAREGALLIGGNVLDFALQTTPQLHHYVRMWNHEAYNKGDWASEAGYYTMLVDGFKQLTATADPKLSSGTLYVDAAHGVGASQMTKLAKEMNDLMTVEIRNTPADGELNHECGAEHVQKGRQHPAGFSRNADRNKRSCSMDGDADRLVYHYFDAEGEWHLLDGDKIASLFALFYKENYPVLMEAGVSMGIVQTAYANGASSAFLNSLDLKTVVAKTGVKNCHHKATQFDIGMYFEANGHGTVLFKDAALERLQKLEPNLTDEAKKQSLARVLASYQVVNQCVGDAMSLILFVEGILRLKNWTIKDWDAIYSDLPSRQTKLPVEDRTKIQCNETETQVTSPVDLQNEINTLVQQVDQGRAFVRPSGTEDVVRVYAEAATPEMADNLALAVAKAVHRIAGGVGDVPSSFVA